MKNFWDWLLKDVRIDRDKAGRLTLSALIEEKTNDDHWRHREGIAEEIKKAVHQQLASELRREIIEGLKIEMLTHFKDQFMEAYAKQITDSLTPEEIIGLTKESFKEAVVKRLNGDMRNNYY
jgi:hypothetical protein